MCTRPSESRPRRDPRPMSPRSRRDRDVQNFVRDETETRRCSFWCAGRDLEAPETLESLGSFSISLRRFPWRMVKHVDNEKKLYGLINLHHGKRFIFEILWVFALYFDNYHWIINGLHHKELQLQCCRHEPLCLSRLHKTSPRDAMAREPRRDLLGRDRDILLQDRDKTETLRILSETRR